MGEDTVDCILKNDDSLQRTISHPKSQAFNFKYIGSYSRNEAINGYKLTNEKLFN